MMFNGYKDKLHVPENFGLLSNMPSAFQRTCHVLFTGLTN